jgi:hypothetical protein
MTSASPSAAASARGITEVLHFTTQKGVLGAIRKQALLSRVQVQDDPDLAFIFTAVWPRRDPDWVDYVSLSLDQINRSLYAKAQHNMPELWWAILSFTPAILDHDGVIFTTTNNVYDEVCQRAPGVTGFEAMFQPSVPWGYRGSVKRRWAGHSANRPTDEQAEVLYPKQIGLEHLQALYVPEDQHRRLVLAWCEVMGQDELPVVVRPDLFA